MRSAEDQIRDLMREVWTAPLGNRVAVLAPDGMLHILPKKRGK